jgi:hypothetical protein
MSKTRNVKDTLRRAWYFPLTRIVVGAVVCSVAMLVSNSILKLLLGSEGDIARIIRWVLSTTILLAAYFFLFRRYEKRDVTELSISALPKDGLFGILLSTLSVSLVIFVLYLLGYYEVLAVNGLIYLLLSLFFFISTAALEEVIFRGIVYRIVEEKLGTNLAVIISALLFGLAHAPNENANAISILSAAAGGVLLGLLFSLTRRLWLPIVFHAGWNWAQASWGAVVSGIEELPNFLQARLDGPELITGGAFGPENSIITVVLVLLLSAAAYYLTWKKGNVIKLPRGVKKANGAA